MAKITFHPEAEEEYQEALAWYFERNPAAADGFEGAVETALQIIVENPESWPLHDDRHRVKILQRYPYHIVYRVEVSGVFVVAVAHGRRRPGYWKDRS